MASQLDLPFWFPILKIVKVKLPLSWSSIVGVMGLGKGKKKAGKLSTMEKKEMPVETDPEKLVKYVCGSNIYTTGEDIKVGITLQHH